MTTTIRGSDDFDTGAVPQNGTLYVRDEKASGVSGGTATAGAYRVRDLNTVVKNTITGASLSSNQVTLPAGTYRARWACPSYATQYNKTALYDTTNSTAYLGMSTYDNSSTSTSNDGFAEFTLVAATTFELQHRVAYTRSTNGFGAAASFGDAEIYSWLVIEQV